MQKEIKKNLPSFISSLIPLLLPIFLMSPRSKRADFLYSTFILHLSPLLHISPILFFNAKPKEYFSSSFLPCSLVLSAFRPLLCSFFKVEKFSSSCLFLSLLWERERERKRERRRLLPRRVLLSFLLPSPFFSVVPKRDLSLSSAIFIVQSAEPRWLQRAAKLKRARMGKKDQRKATRWDIVLLDQKPLKKREKQTNLECMRHILVRTGSVVRSITYPLDDRRDYDMHTRLGTCTYSRKVE